MQDLIGGYERAVFHKCLEELLAAEPGVMGAMICTSDGFEIAGTLPEGLSPATLSAMASSQLALSDAMCREANLGHCRDMVVDASGGKVLVMEVPRCDRRLLLAAIGDARHTLGQVLYACKAAAEAIAAGIGREEVRN